MIQITPPVSPKRVYPNYAYTLTIPSFKKVNYNDIYKKFSLFNIIEQQFILEGIITSHYTKFCEKYDIHFEEHKDGRYHAHGTFYNCEDPSIIPMIICNSLGIKRPHQYEHYILVKIISNNEKWQEYVLKDDKQNSFQKKDYSNYKFGKRNNVKCPI